MHYYHGYLFIITVLVCCAVQLKATTSELLVHRGDNTIFHCGESERYASNIVWKSTGINLQASRFKTLERGGLSIQDVQPSDTGLYECLDRDGKIIIYKLKLKVYVLPDYDQQVTLSYTVPECKASDNIKDKLASLRDRLCMKYNSTHVSNCVFTVTSKCTVMNGETSPRNQGTTHRLLVTVHQTTPIVLERHRCPTPPECMKEYIYNRLESNFPLVQELAREEQEDRSTDLIYLNRTLPKKFEHTCPGGYRIKKDPVQICIPCEPGYFSNSSSAGCAECPKHTYTDNHAQSLCTPCPNGTATTATGSSGKWLCRSNAAPVVEIVAAIIISIVLILGAVGFAAKAKESKDQAKQKKAIEEEENNPQNSLSDVLPLNVPANISNNAYRRTWDPVTQQPVYVDHFEMDSTRLIDNEHRSRPELRHGQSRETVRDFMSGLKDGGRYDSYMKRNYNCNARGQRGSRHSLYRQVASRQYKPIREFKELESQIQSKASIISTPERKYDYQSDIKPHRELSGSQGHIKSAPSATRSQQDHSCNPPPNDHISIPDEKPLRQISQGGLNLCYSAEPFSYTHEPCRRKSISDINKHTHDENRQPCKPYSYSQPNTSYNDALFHDSQNDLVDKSRYPENREEILVDQASSNGNRVCINNSAEYHTKNHDCTNNPGYNSVHGLTSAHHNLSRSDTVEKRANRNTSVDNRACGNNQAGYPVSRNSSAENKRRIAETKYVPSTNQRPDRIKARDPKFGYHPSLLSIPHNVTQNPLRRGEDGFQQNEENKATRTYNNAKEMINCSLKEKLAMFDRYKETQSSLFPHLMYVNSEQKKSSPVRNASIQSTTNTNPYSDTMPVNSRDTSFMQTNNNAILQQDSPYQQHRTRYIEHVERKLSHIERNAQPKHSQNLHRQVLNKQPSHQPSWREKHIVHKRPKCKTVDKEETSSFSSSSSSGTEDSSSSGSDDSSTVTASDSSSSGSSTSQSSDTSEEEKVTNVYDTVVDETDRESMAPPNYPPPPPQPLSPSKYKIFKRPTPPPPPPPHYSDPNTCRQRPGQQNTQYELPDLDLLSSRLDTVPSFVQSEIASPYSRNKNQNANTIPGRDRHPCKRNNDKYSDRNMDKNQIRPSKGNNATQRDKFNDNSRLHHKCRQPQEQNNNNIPQGQRVTSRETSESHIKVTSNISAPESLTRVPSRRYTGSRPLSLSPVKRSDLKPSRPSVGAPPIAKRSSSLGPGCNRMAYKLKQHLRNKGQNFR